MKLPQITLIILASVLFLSCKDSFVNTKDSSSPIKNKPVTPESLDSIPLKDKPIKNTNPKTKGLDTLKPKIAALRTYDQA
jgi:hypothetical protein